MLIWAEKAQKRISFVKGRFVPDSADEYFLQSRSNLYVLEITTKSYLRQTSAVSTLLQVCKYLNTCIFSHFKNFNRVLGFFPLSRRTIYWLSLLFIFHSKLRKSGMVNSFKKVFINNDVLLEEFARSLLILTLEKLHQIQPPPSDILGTPWSFFIFFDFNFSTHIFKVNIGWSEKWG